MHVLWKENKLWTGIYRIIYHTLQMTYLARRLTIYKSYHLLFTLRNTHYKVIGNRYNLENQLKFLCHVWFPDSQLAIYTLLYQLSCLVCIRHHSYFLTQSEYWYIIIIHNNGSTVNTLRPRQNGRHFQTTFSNAFSWIKTHDLIKISLKFVP